MSELAILTTLASHAFLEGLSEQQRMRLVWGAKPFRAAPGEYLAKEGDSAHALYLIESGQVSIESQLGERGVVSIQTLGPGDLVGWSWLLPPHLWQFDARTIDAVQGLLFDAAWLRDECEEDHELGYHLLKRLLAVVSSRLAASRIHYLDIYK
jgi:CRP/FNR family transcriptional regulator, cyclic AMP receptor protein